jgi:hypothetical protein
LQYIKCIDAVQLFVVAERTGNWLLHLEVVQQFLPIFAATGHYNYAKCGRLYLQQMRQLPLSHPDLYQHFLNGNHTIRRSDRFWSGLSMDLVIEQTMMRAIKSHGGLTRGRGMHETIRTTWLSTMTECATIRSALSQVVDIEKGVSSHVEIGPSRMRRDMPICIKLKAFSWCIVLSNFWTRNV